MDLSALPTSMLMALFAAAAVLATVVTLTARWALKLLPARGRHISPSDVYAIACLTGGSQGMAATAVTALAARTTMPSASLKD